MNRFLILLIASLTLLGAGCAAQYVQNTIEADASASNGYGLGYGASMMHGGRQSITRANCLADECLALEDVEYPVGALSDEIVQALDTAIQDEYKALATYEATINAFGSVRPFIMIARAEESHINALKAVYDRYGLAIPDSRVGRISVADTIEEMCEAGVQAEIDNAALYRDELLPLVTDYEDITFVFTNLMNASQDKHLPAFERCAGK